MASVTSFSRVSIPSSLASMRSRRFPIESSTVLSSFKPVQPRFETILPLFHVIEAPVVQDQRGDCDARRREALVSEVMTATRMFVSIRYTPPTRHGAR
jgi:hypothetical protein